MWLLEADGTLHEGEAPNRSIDAEASLGETPDAGPLAVRFAATQDGRGFSRAHQLRARGFTDRLVALGPLEPDQARHAFQCGFDAVAIENDTFARHGREAWAGALEVSVTELYAPRVESRLDSTALWNARAGL